MAPHTGDEEAYNPVTWEPSIAFVKYAIWAILVSSVLVSLTMYYMVPTMKDRASWTVPMVLVALAGWYLLRRGNLQAAIGVLAIGMWACVAAMVILGGGLSAPAHYIFPLIIFMMGWLVSTKAAVITAGLTSALTIAVIMMGERGTLPESPVSPPALQGLIQICVFVTATVLVHSLVRAYKKRLMEVHATNIGFAQRTRDLEIAKAELHQAQAQAKVGSWIYTVATDTMQLSDEACRIFGQPIGTTLNRETYLELSPPEDREALQINWRNASESQSIFEDEHRVLVSGAIFWLRQRAEFELARDGSITRVFGIAQDINERKLAELSLRQSEKKFATAFQSSPVAASIATLQEGRFVEANDKYERDFGWARDELIGRTTGDINLWPSPDVREQWAVALQAHGSIVDYETTWIHKNGERRSVSISGEIIDYASTPCILAYITDITERKAAEEQIQSLAFFDSLTSLPNRRLLMNRLEQALASTHRDQRHGGLLFIDLDNFKTLNDSYGHNKGDLLLKQVADRLSACVREGDTVSRLGGDEFVVMLNGLSEDPLLAASQAEMVAEKILVNLNQRYDFIDFQYHNTPSIGVTLFGEQEESLDEPLRRADVAMYQAKAAGRNTIRFYDPQMQAAVSARMQLETDLAYAVRQNQFLLLYQPQVNATGCVTGAEVLVRWQHPQRGMVSPAEFIPAAEETGLILPLGAWILETACSQLANWADQPAFEPLNIAVNVSARQFQQVDFVAQVLATLERTNANPKRLKLELTESMLIDNVSAVIEKMTALKEHGVGFSLDDFGTGYSSLSYLKQLPLDQLKIDQSFVRDVLTDTNDAAIARMIIVLAESLGLTVIAEGVETIAQQELLLSQGCQNFQGYLISRPVVVGLFEDFVKSRA